MVEWGLPSVEPRITLTIWTLASSDLMTASVGAINYTNYTLFVTAL